MFTCVRLYVFSDIQTKSTVLQIHLTTQMVYSSAPYSPQHLFFITAALSSVDRTILASSRDFPYLCHVWSETHTHSMMSTAASKAPAPPRVQKPCVGNEVVHHVKMPLYSIIHPNDKFLTSCRPVHSPNDTPGDCTWHWEWISGVALAICIWVGAHFHGPPRTTLTVMLNWFPPGRAGEQFTESQWESCGDVRRYSQSAEEGLCSQSFQCFVCSRLGVVTAFLNCQMLCFVKAFT